MRSQLDVVTQMFCIFCHLSMWSLLQNGYLQSKSLLTSSTHTVLLIEVNIQKKVERN